MSEKAQPAQPQGDRLKLRDMMWAFTGSQALCAAAKLRIADILVDRPKTAHELAEAIAADEPALLRLLRALTSVDVLVEDEQGRFSATPMGELLRSDHPQSMRAAAIFLGSSFIWRSWTNLDQSIMTGKPAFELVHGERYFEHLANTPEDSILFNAFASGDSARAVETVLDVYDFSGFTRIVDVGGGQGALLRGILESNARATGVLFELPGVLAGTHELLQSAVAPRCEIIGGDMFQSVPPGGDVYILRGVLHDWSDAEVIQILRNCRQAIKATGKLLVLEFVNAAPGQADFAKWLDLMMLVLLTGRERTQAEFRDLYAAAGFRLTRVIPTRGHAIIEGVPV